MNNSLRQEYLDIIGIQNWQLKSASDNDDYETASLPVDEQLSGSHPDFLTEVIEQVDTINSFADEKSIHQAPQINTLSIEETVISEPAPILETEQTSAPIVTEPTVIETVAAVTVESDSAETVSVNKIFDSNLVKSILSCQKCTSRTKRLNALVGQGSTTINTELNNTASIFVISDAPNAEEDRCGQYMAGSAQILFDRMLKTIGFDHDFFLTGIVKCHSMEQYLISESDLNNCTEFLYAQLEQIKPGVVIVLGAASAQALLKTSKSFNELRGKIHNVKLNQTDYSVIVTFHPAYLLRNPLFKKEAMADLIRIKSALK